MNILSHKDTYYTADRDEITYVVRLGTTETAVFYGRAVKSPTEPYIYIKINDIVQQYLDANMPDFRNYSNNVTLNSNGFLPFRLYEVETYTATTDGTTTTVAKETLLETYNVRYGYDYTEEWDGESVTLSNPVNGHMDSRMKLFWSAYLNNSDNFDFTSSCPVTGGTPTTGSTPSVDSGSTIYTGGTGTFVVTGGDGAQFNNGSNVWVIQYNTDYPSVYYVFSGTTGFSTGYTSGGEVSFYIPANTESAATWTVDFYPYDGGALLDTATSTQGDITYSFAFNNVEGETLSSASTQNTVTWTSTYPSITYIFYHGDTLLASGNTLGSGVTVYFDASTDTANTENYSFEAYFNGVLIDTLTWKQGAASEQPDTGSTGSYYGKVVLKVQPVGYIPAFASGQTSFYVSAGYAEWNGVVSGGAPSEGGILYVTNETIETRDGWDWLTLVEAGWPQVGEIDGYTLDTNVYNMRIPAGVSVSGDVFSRYYYTGDDYAEYPDNGYNITAIEICEGPCRLGTYGDPGGNAHALPDTLAYMKIPSTTRVIENYIFSGCTGLTSIYYNGTVAMFGNVRLAEHWKDGSSISIVHCTDGDVSAPSYQFPD